MSARLFLSLLVLLSGCSSYVAPTTVHVDAAALDESRLIPYRTLVRADFKAVVAPAAMDAKSVGAVTAALLRTSCCNIVTYRQTTGSAYVAVVQNLRFEALMSQNHSWWKSSPATSDAELLEHEQTHFAFSELGARAANARIDEIKARISSMASTEAEAVRLARERLQREVDHVQSDIAERNAVFDRDTRNGLLCESNHRWFAVIQVELRETDPSARNPALSTLNRHATAVLANIGPLKPE